MIHPLGPLEAKVMDVLWNDPDNPLPVREVIERLEAHPTPAYNTIKTVLDNLLRKGWVERLGSHSRYRYLPAETREAHAARVIGELVSGVDDLDCLMLTLTRCASSRELDAIRKALSLNG
jgi:predicted transcriptional regulator